MAWNIYASVYNTVGKRLNTVLLLSSEHEFRIRKVFRTVTTKSQQNQLQGLPRFAHPQAIMRNKMDLWKSTLRLYSSTYQQMLKALSSTPDAHQE